MEKLFVAGFTEATSKAGRGTWAIAMGITKAISPIAAGIVFSRAVLLHQSLPTSGSLKSITGFYCTPGD